MAVRRASPVGLSSKGVRTADRPPPRSVSRMCRRKTLALGSSSVRLMKSKETRRLRQRLRSANRVDSWRWAAIDSATSRQSFIARAGGVRLGGLRRGHRDLATGLFNPSTPAGPFNFLHHFADQGSDGLERDPVAEHVAQQGLPVGIHIVHFAQIERGLAIVDGRQCGQPALAEFATHAPERRPSRRKRSSPELSCSVIFSMTAMAVARQLPTGLHAVS